MARAIRLTTAVVIFLCLLLGALLPSLECSARAEYRGELLATFSTSLKGSSSNRIFNVTLATSRIDGVVVQSGEVFSFNGATGERTKENGYKESSVIEYGKFTLGYGGGVCQVSTTLYNAVIRAGLKIVSVSSHSLPVSYVPVSTDAMVSKATDFRFFNDTPYPITLRGSVERNVLTFCVFGFKTITDGERVEFVSKSVEVLKASYDEVVDAENRIPDGKDFLVIKEPKDGVVSECYKEVYFENRLVESTLFRRDRYLPQNGVRLVRGVRTEN